MSNTWPATVYVFVFTLYSTSCVLPGAKLITSHTKRTHQHLRSLTRRFPPSHLPIDNSCVTRQAVQWALSAAVTTKSTRTHISSSNALVMWFCLVWSNLPALSGNSFVCGLVTWESGVVGGQVAQSSSATRLPLSPDGNGQKRAGQRCCS